MKSQIKKLISVFACVCLLLTAIIIPVSAETGVTISFADKANRTSFDKTVAQVWEQNGIKVTNNKGAGSNIGDYAGPVRFYANSELIVEYPGMTKIEIAASAAKYIVTADSITDANATATVTDTVTTITFANPVDSFTIPAVKAQARINSMTVYAAAQAEVKKGSIVVDSTAGKTGGTVDVNIGFETNPGIVSAKLKVAYDANALEIVGKTAGEGFEKMTFGEASDNPFVVNWIDVLNPDNTTVGTFATLKFKIKNTATEGFSPITVTYDQADVYDAAFEEVVLEVADGGIEISYCEHANTDILIENEVELSCTQDEKHDEITFCNDCGSEVARETVVTKTATGHSFNSEGVCSVCGTPKFSNPTIFVEKVNATAGETVDVNVNLALNPGIISAKLWIAYDSNVLEITGRTAGANFGGMAFSKDFTANPYIANWVDSINPNNTTNGSFITLTFKVKDTAVEGFTAIKVTYDPEDIYNEDWDNVAFDVENGGISVVPCQHTNTKTEIENQVDADCDTAGSYEEVVYCNVCGKEVSRNTVTIDALGHTEGTAVEENRIEADCVNAGSFDTVVYCSVCGAELSRETTTIDALGHTPDDAVRENIVAGDCVTDATYESVVYCAVCDAEISRETIVTTKAPGHDFNADNNCNVCGESKFTEPTIYVDNVEGKAGDTINVSVNLAKNPGIVSAKIKIAYDSNALELIDKNAGAGFNGMAYSQDLTVNPYTANWVDSINPDNTTNGAFVTLTFRIKDTAAIAFSPITITYDPDDIYNLNWDNVAFAIENGGVNVVACEHLTTKTETENSVEPDCENAGSYDTVVYCEDCGAEISRETITVDALGHTEGVAVEENRVDADCENAGSYDTVVYCTVCGKEISRETTTIDALGHTEGAAVEENRVDADCVNAGSYDTVVYCTVCGKEISRETTIVDALGHTPGDAVRENIVAGDCVTDATYESVVYCTVCGEELSRETIVTNKAPGHDFNADNNCNVCGESKFTEPTIFVNTAEGTVGNTVNVTVNLAKNPGIVSMKLEIAYDSDVLELVDKKAGDAFSEMAYSQYITVNPYIANWVNSINPDNATNGSFVTLTFKIKDTAAVGFSPITVSFDQADIYNSNWEDVVFAVENGGVNVLACGHTSTKTESENRVEPDCENTGSYESVVYCADCGAELSRETVVIEALGHDPIAHDAKAPTCTEIGWNAYETCSRCDYTTYQEIAALGHTEGTAVEENRIEADCVNAGSYDVVIYCSVCGEELSRETVVIDALGHSQGEAVEENRIEADCVNAGSYDVVIYCSVCGEELSRETVVIDALGHSQGEAVEENRIEADCVNAGSYDVVIYCSVCGEELSRETVVIEALGHDSIAHDAKAPTCTEIGWNAYETCSRCDYTTYEEIAALGHTEGEAVEENRIEADCVNAGSYDVVVYCSVCGEEISRETVVIEALGHDPIAHDAKAPTCTEIGWNAYETCSRCDYTTYEEIAALGHTEGEAVEEHRIEADCVNAGSYESVVYCSVCGEEISRETVVIEALGHTEGEAVEENRVEADCVNAGSYESVVYCSVCGEELSRETIVIDALGHTYGETTVVEPTYGVEGYSTHTCTVCGHEEKFDFVEALPYTLGDINGDDKINNRDLAMFMQYLNDWDIEIIEIAADVNCDGRVNNKDYALLLQYVNKWNVQLG